MLTVTNGDCMALMAGYPGKYFDLAIVDPPYGIGQDWKKRDKGPDFPETSYENECIPGRAYFDELFRVSKNQIVWGYNYFAEILGPTNYLIVWDKMSGNNSVFRYSKCEIAWTSIRVPANIYSVPWCGYRRGRETGTRKIHPQQKPVQLYESLLADYAERGGRILDTHLGSGSIAVACHNLGFDLTACEIDKTYFGLAIERVNRHTARQEAQRELFEKKELYRARNRRELKKEKQLELFQD
jgi:site-specific DNA-methyltransferase (adenine-specific)